MRALLGLPRSLPLLRAGACVLSLGLVAVGARAALARSTPGAPALPTPATGPLGSDAPLDPEPPGDVSTELQIMVAGAALTDGDAPGTDSSVLPRPLGSTRLIDAPLGVSGSRIRVYATTQAAAEVMAETARNARARGLVDTRLSGDPYTWTYARGRTHVVARFSLREDRVLVSLIETELRTAEERR
ncbi:MAG: hypothetical protein JWP97_157 [Labilithrix sp.]|nr:hypothetical protein [Labilithrix sp.]